MCLLIVMLLQKTVPTADYRSTTRQSSQLRWWRF
jgi:hypothetical protein